MSKRSLVNKRTYVSWILTRLGAETRTQSGVPKTLIRCGSTGYCTMVAQGQKFVESSLAPAQKNLVPLPTRIQCGSTPMVAGTYTRGLALIGLPSPIGGVENVDASTHIIPDLPLVGTGEGLALILGQTPVVQLRRGGMMGLTLPLPVPLDVA